MEAKTTIDLDRHDRHQLEIKINYPSLGRDNTSRWERFLSFIVPQTVDYNTDVYFLIPPAAGIGSGDYQEEDFYSDMRSYTRLTAPKINLEYLLDVLECNALSRFKAYPPPISPWKLQTDP